MKTIKLPSDVEMLTAMRGNGDRSELTEGYVYATLGVGVTAKGESRLFSVPQTHQLPWIGVVVGTPPKQTAEHTNVVQAGQLGSLGCACFSTLRVTGLGIADGFDGRLEIVVGGKKVFAAPLAPLLAKTRTEPRELKVPILVADTDTLEARVHIAQEVTQALVPDGFGLLKVELGGAFSQDVGV